MPETTPTPTYAPPIIQPYFNLIMKTPGVCGGAARFIRTRIPVWLLEGLRRDGASDGELLQTYPQLTANDLTQAWAYVEANKEEIDREIALNDKDDEDEQD